MLLGASEIAQMKRVGVWSEDCPIHYSDLTKVTIQHHCFLGFSHPSVLIIHKALKQAVQSIFEEIYRLKFPIQHMLPAEVFDGDDIKSREANNSYAFFGRKANKTDRWSSHAYGVAIDINPRQNPVVYLNKFDSTITVQPSGSLDYVNRNVQKSGMVEPIVEIFAKYGFTEWGGNWEHKPDYHHFQLPWSRIKEMFPEAILP